MWPGNLARSKLVCSFHLQCVGGCLRSIAEKQLSVSSGKAVALRRHAVPRGHTLHVVILAVAAAKGHTAYPLVLRELYSVETCARAGHHHGVKLWISWVW